MNTILDAVLMRGAPPLAAGVWWSAIALVVVSYIPRVSGWLTDADLDHEDDDDLDHLTVKRGEFR